MPLPNEPFNDRTPMLINDLDVRVASDSDEFFPWRMEPNSEYNNFTDAAGKGDNFRDNIEVISVKNIEAGEYTLTVSHKGILQSGSQDFSLIINGIESETTSTQSIVGEERVSVYPNPVKDFLNIDFDDNEYNQIKVTVYNLAGQQQGLPELFNQSPAELDARQLAKGTYVLKVQDDSSRLISSQRIVIP